VLKEVAEIDGGGPTLLLYITVDTGRDGTNSCGSLVSTILWASFVDCMVHVADDAIARDVTAFTNQTR